MTDEKHNSIWLISVNPHHPGYPYSASSWHFRIERLEAITLVENVTVWEFLKEIPWRTISLANSLDECCKFRERVLRQRLLSKREPSPSESCDWVINE